MSLKLNRQQLAQFLPNHEAIKAFENLFENVQVDIPDSLDELKTSSENAQVQASEALGRLAEIAQTLSLALYGVYTEPVSQDQLAVPSVQLPTETYIPPVSLDKHAVGLSNVDNTSDANKPVSTAQQTALNLKANSALENWQTPTLLNSWVNFGGTFASASYYKDNFGIVHLRGLIKSGTMGASAFQLPSGYRPSAEELFPTVSSTGAGACNIQAGGDVIPSGGANGYFSLAGISFRGV